MRKIPIFLLLLSLVPHLLFADDISVKENEWNIAFSKCKGYETPSIIKLESGENIYKCNPKEYSVDTKIDVTNYFSVIAEMCTASSDIFCLNKATHFEERGITFVFYSLSLTDAVDDLMAKDSGYSRAEYATSVAEKFMQVLLFSLNPWLGDAFGISADYSKVKSLVKSPYGLNNVAVGIVAHDASIRYVGYATGNTENFSYRLHFEENDFATPEQLVFYGCDYRTKGCSHSSVKVVESK